MDSGAKERDTRGRHYDGLRAEAATRRVGIGVILARDGEVLLGLRRGSHGAGTWSFPGGHLDHGESAEACASRELYEETGLEATNAHVVAETIDDFPGGLRYRTLFVRVDWAGGEPALREPVVEIVNAVAGVGLDGDRYAYGRGHYQDDRVSRDVTLIEAEALEALAREHGIGLAVGETRRNLTTRGISLNDLVGRRFWVGDVLCQGTRLCEPCQYLADLTGKPLLRPLVHRGGLRADILRGGVIRRGDRVRPAEG